METEQDFIINIAPEKIVKLYKDNLIGKLQGHIIIFGPLSVLKSTISSIRQRTQKPVCYFSEVSMY